MRLLVVNLTCKPFYKRKKTVLRFDVVIIDGSEFHTSNVWVFYFPMAEMFLLLIYSSPYVLYPTTVAGGESHLKR